MQKMRAANMPIQAIANELQISFGTVQKHTKGIVPTKQEKTQANAKVFKQLVADGEPIDVAASKAKVSKVSMQRTLGLGVRMPEAVKRDASPHVIDVPGRWLILSDIHLPQHDVPAVEAAIAEAKRRGVVGVLLNGDILDCHELSVHDKDKNALRYVDELRIGREFFAYMRQQFPKAEFVYKLGNHEERLGKYIIQRAPALEGIEGVDLPSCLNARDHGVSIIRDKRLIRLGKLNVLHGHEYQGGGGVNPARWLFLRARSVALCGHFHRTSEHHAKDISDKYQAAWSAGCLCDLKPLYAPHNEWNHGFCFAEVGNDGDFSVQNIRVMEGKIR
jgi:predicted phosphodiesterase